ncbi:hypothetical protein [Agrobacterium pusense]|uniref:hypothetical protein n=1 Tax=Agrobacterium pusense TaxID=648995 RepID=UPI00269CF3BC
MTADTVKHTSGPYEAIGKVIRKKPVQTKTETGTLFEVGFPVCEVTEYLDEDGAKAVAALMNRGDVLPYVLAALREIAGNGDGTGRNPQLMVDAALAAIAKAEGRS